MDKTSRDLRCQDCRASCISDFKQVVHLENSELIIYAHKEMTGKKKTKSAKEIETFVFHNTSDKELKRPEFINELCTFKTRYFQCRTVVQRVKSLLDEITAIRRDEALGICDHCKRSNPAGKCRRCEYMVNKFLCNKVKQYEVRQSRFKLWLCKVRLFLQEILETDKLCKHKIYRESNATAELENLLKELRSPLTMREPKIGIFPVTESGKLSLDSLTESKELLEQYLYKLRSSSMGKHYTSDESLYVSPSKTATSCVFKYFMDKKIEERCSMEVITTESPQPQLINTERSDIIDTVTESKDKLNSIKERATKEKPSSKDIVHSIKEIAIKKKSFKEIPSKITDKKGTTKASKEKTLDKENIPSKKALKAKTSKEPKPNAPKLSSEEQLFLQLMKEKQKEKLKTEKVSKQDKVKSVPIIDNLPEPKHREKIISIVEEVSESVVECGDQHADKPEEMIKGVKIVPFDPHHKVEDTDSVVPIFYKVQSDCPETAVKPVSANDSPETNSKKMIPEVKSLASVFKYELSNPEFIDKGLTILPTTKIMRRMNIYKMEPSKGDWFERHKDRKKLFYDTGEKLAEIDDQGHGKWFYKNGLVALDYYNSTGLNGSKRYVIYSSGEEGYNGKNMPVTVLASFDYRGNGVVYDHFGNIRLKYNQSEGVVIDDKIGPPGRWKWHTLNDPPVLQSIFLNTHVKHPSPCMEKILKNQRDEAGGGRNKLANAEMLAIELDNFVKEKANKMLQKFKPFQIRMKVLKLNDQFSLRVLDQANVNLQFRDPPTFLKLNLGMNLISNEIIDTDMAEVSQVATPYDRTPPNSQSVTNIQQTLNRARKIGNFRARKNNPTDVSISNT